jgi:putative ATP-dependent DNA ligase
MVEEKIEEIEKILKTATTKGKAQKMDQDIEYVKFKDKVGKIERGTVIHAKTIIPGYPHIKRIFTLKKGIAKNIKGNELFIEEKIDGFNVRIASIESKVFGFSRGGFLDLFVTEKANEANFEAFFQDNPEVIICAEMVGNTPHTQPTKKFDVKILIFDIINERGEYLNPQEKYRILEEYNLEGVPKLGEFKNNEKEIKKIEKISLKINKNGCEGMIIRSEIGEKIKYVNANSDIKSLGKGAKKIFDMPLGFFIQRMLRSAIYISDFKLKNAAYAKKIGEEILSNLQNQIKSIKNGEGVSDSHEILISDLRIWSEIKRGASKEITIEEVGIKEEGDKFRIRFKKHFKESEKLIREYLDGKAIED